MPSPDPQPQTLSRDQVRALADLMQREDATAVRISLSPVYEREVPLGKVATVEAECFTPFHGWWTYDVRPSGAWSMRGSEAWHAPPPEPDSPVAVAIEERGVECVECVELPPEGESGELPDLPF